MGKKTSKPAQEKVDNGSVWPLVVYMWIVGSGILSYMLARIMLASRPHPYHWLAGVMGMAFGMAVGWLWYHWRGDIA